MIKNAQLQVPQRTTKMPALESPRRRDSLNPPGQGPRPRQQHPGQQFPHLATRGGRGRSPGLDEAGREDLGGSHEQLMQGGGSTRVGGEKTPGREVASHPRQQAGGRGGAEGANIAEGTEIRGVTRNRKSEGPELVVEVGEKRERRAKQAEGEKPQFCLLYTSPSPRD